MFLIFKIVTYFRFFDGNDTIILAYLEVTIKTIINIINHE